MSSYREKEGITGRCYYLNLRNEELEDDKGMQFTYPKGLYLDVNKLYSVPQCCMTWKVRIITTNEGALLQSVVMARVQAMI
jgi:hypothetical protein